MAQQAEERGEEMRALIQTRSALADWAKDKPEDVQGLVWVIRWQMRALGECRHTTAGDVVRDVLGQNLKRLAEATRH